MSETKTTLALEQLLVVLVRSFPAYLEYARPYSTQQDTHLLNTLDQIVADQEHLAERISQLMRAAGHPARLGEFPMEYTDLHDLSTEYIVRMAIEYQKQDIAEIEELVDELRMAPMALALAEEARGLAKGHLETMQELTLQPAPAVIP
jgi:hypothetical protein